MREGHDRWIQRAVDGLPTVSTAHSRYQPGGRWLRLVGSVNRPLLTQYVDWLSNAVRGDLGSSWFTGQQVAGAWTLYAADDAGGITGTLNSWSLALCVTP